MSKDMPFAVATYAKDREIAKNIFRRWRKFDRHFDVGVMSYRFATSNFPQSAAVIAPTPHPRQRKTPAIKQVGSN
jgi:hypothetical protein